MRPEVAGHHLIPPTWHRTTCSALTPSASSPHDAAMYTLGWHGGVMEPPDHGLTLKDAELPDPTRWTTDRNGKAEDGTLPATARAMDESGHSERIAGVRRRPALVTHHRKRRQHRRSKRQRTRLRLCETHHRCQRWRHLVERWALPPATSPPALHSPSIQPQAMHANRSRSWRAQPIRTATHSFTLGTSVSKCRSLMGPVSTRTLPLEAPTP